MVKFRPKSRQMANTIENEVLLSKRRKGKNLNYNFEVEIFINVLLFIKYRGNKMTEATEQQKKEAIAVVSGEISKESAEFAKEFAKAAGFKGEYSINTNNNGPSTIKLEGSFYHNVEISPSVRNPITSVTYAVPIADNSNEMYKKGSLIEVMQHISEKQGLEFAIHKNTNKFETGLMYATFKTTVADDKCLEIAKTIGNIDNMLMMYLD